MAEFGGQLGGIYVTFDAVRLRKLRQQRGVSQETLATAADISATTLTSAEAARRCPRPRVVKALAAALGVAPESLLRSGDGPLTLRTVRERLGLSQADIASAVGRSRQMVSKVERGATRPSSPARWAVAYQLTLRQWNLAHRAAKAAARTAVRKAGGTI